MIFNNYSSTNSNLVEWPGRTITTTLHKKCAIWVSICSRFQQFWYHSMDIDELYKMTPKMLKSLIYWCLKCTKNVYVMLLFIIRPNHYLKTWIMMNANPQTNWIHRVLRICFEYQYFVIHYQYWYTASGQLVIIRKNAT